LRSDLGLPAGCTLKAELHNALVYAQGQFFLPQGSPVHRRNETQSSLVSVILIPMYPRETIKRFDLFLAD